MVAHVVDPLFQFLYLGRLPVEQTLKNLEIHRQRLPKYNELIKLRQDWDNITLQISPFIASLSRTKLEIKSPNGQLNPSDAATCPDAKASAHPDPDRTKVAYLTLACRDALATLIDWQHYVTLYSEDIEFQLAQSEIDRFVSAIEAVTPEEFLASRDTSALNLLYYRVTDPLGAKVRHPRLNMLSSAWLLRHYFEIAGRLAQQSTDNAQSYFDRIVHSYSFHRLTTKLAWVFCRISMLC